MVSQRAVPFGSLGPYSTISFDLRLDLGLGLCPDPESHLRRSGYEVKLYSQRKIIETLLSRNLSHDVSLISVCCLVWVTFFHSVSMATIVTSPWIHDSSITVHGCTRTWIDDDDKNDTPCSQHNIFEYPKPVVNVFVWEDLSTHRFCFHDSNVLYL